MTTPTNRARRFLIMYAQAMLAIALVAVVSCSTVGVLALVIYAVGLAVGNDWALSVVAAVLCFVAFPLLLIAESWD